MKRKYRISNRKKLAMINTIVFSTVLGMFGIFFFVFPRQEVSDFEKRKLSPWPHYSLDSLLEGKFIDSIDLYAADHFPFRDQLVELSFDMKDWRGIKNEEIAFYNASDIKTNEPVKPIRAVDTVSDTTTTVEDTTAGPPGEEVNNLFIVEGRAMEIFGGNCKMAESYARAINKYQAELGYTGVHIYDVAVPSSIEYFAPNQYKKQYSTEKKNIDCVYGALDPGVKGVDAYTELAAHTDENIYFRTDHHWTGLGAYYAYVAFCKSSGQTALRLDQMEHKQKTGYLGSLYWLTRDSRLKDNPDTVDYWKIPGTYKTTVFSKGNQTKGMKGSIYAESASGANGYGVFLGGDWPLMKIESDVKNGKKCVLVKNSYGNPFGTYLPYHYETVYVVDYRYYTGSLRQLIIDEKINDLIFLNGVFSINTSWHIMMVGKIMNGVGKAATNTPPPADSLKPKNDSAVKESNADSIPKEGDNK